MTDNLEATQSPWFSWDGNKINGFPFPTKNLRMGHSNSSCGPVKNMKNWYKNTEIYGIGHQSRKKFRRALRLARGVRDQEAISILFKRVNLVKFNEPAGA